MEELRSPQWPQIRRRGLPTGSPRKLRDPSGPKSAEGGCRQAPGTLFCAHKRQASERAAGRQLGEGGARKAGPLGTKMLLKSRGPEPVFRTWRSRDGRLLCTRRASLNRQLDFCKRVAVECKVDIIATLHSTSCPPAKPLIAHRRPMSSANYFPHVRDECRCGGAGTVSFRFMRKVKRSKAPDEQPGGAQNMVIRGSDSQ